MKKLMLIILLSLIIFNLFYCKSNNTTSQENINNTDQSSINHEETKKAKIIKIIKRKTKTDLKKLGLKKILLSNNGRWHIWTEEYIFKRDGRFLFSKHSSILLTQYWKVKNGNLYINLNSPKYGKKFYRMLTKAAENFSYSPGFMNKIKYVLSIKSKKLDKNNRPILSLTLFMNK